MSNWKYAFSMSQDEVKAAMPPGTMALMRRKQSDVAEQEVLSRTRETSLRSPQPSNDPADPLNWPRWRKLAILFIVALYAFVANLSSANISAGLQVFNATFPHDVQPFSKLAYLISVNTLFLGVSNVFWVPMARCLGRRAVLLSATLLMTLASAWCAAASTYESLLAARIFQGIGAAASETVAPAVIGDIFFVDQRGRAMAVYTFFLSCGPILGGIIGGYIAFSLGWVAIFEFSIGLSTVIFVCTLFVVPETTYNRRTPVLESTELETWDDKDGAGVAEIEMKHPTSSYGPYTFAQSLGFPKPQSGFLSAFIKPFLTLYFPATWVVMLQYGGLVGGIVTISTIGPQLVSEPPYNWGANAGLINIGGLVGSLVGTLYTFLVADAALQRQARKHGLAEPEDRLLVIFPSLIIATGGFFIFGFVAQNPSPIGWLGLEIGYGMLALGLMQVPSVDFNYLLDSYPEIASDCFLMNTIFRAAFGFIMTFFVANWIAAAGPAVPFSVFGSIFALFSLLTIPLWLFGKRIRIATASRAGGF